MKAETNSIQDQLTAALSDDGAKWWGRDGSAERVYLNPPRFAGTRYAKTIKLWISFADPLTLAGAELHVRVDIAQHPNWIAAEEAKWTEQFEHVLDAVAEVREQAGLDEQQEAAAVEEKEVIDATIREAMQDEAKAVREQAVLDIEFKRVAAGSVAEIKNQYGNVDVRIPLGPNFVEVAFSEHELTESGIPFARAMTGFADEVRSGKPKSRGGRGTHTVSNVPQFGGFVILKSDLPRVKTSAEIAAEKSAARTAAKKQAAQAAGFASVAAHDRHLKAEAAKAAAAQRVEWERREKQLAAEFYVGKTQGGNIVVRDGKGRQWCLVTTGEQAGKWVENATFPLAIASLKVDAADARAAAETQLQPA